MTRATAAPTGGSTSGPTRAETCERFRQATAQVLKLDHLPAEWNANVTGFLVMAAAAADLYLDVPLDEAYDEAAPVFEPVGLHAEPVEP